jgi:hypothetical protein
VSADLLRMIDGFRVTQTIYAAVELGIPDVLGDGERSADELAEASGADSSALYRLLRALASLGVLHETDDRRFTLTELGQPLRADAPGSLRGWARLSGREYFWSTWGNLTSSIRTGENTFRSVHGTNVWEWRAAHPEESALFDDAMRSTTLAANSAILAAYDFGRFGTVVDVGGGTGTLLAAILQAHPGTRGVLFDQEHVVSGAGAVLAKARVADRCEVVSGSFFSAVPKGGDAYVLKWIIHDWEDADCVAILRTCRDAMGTDAVVLVIERALGAPNESVDAKLSDLNMLVMPGGRERTQEEYADLFARAGLRFVSSSLATSGHAVMEAAPA